MSRLVKESDEEIDVKPGRKIRANIEVISADSPLRRSSRIKPNVKQNESSPESPLSDSSIVSTTQTSRITRQRASAMENSAINENRRTLRSRISSISSDINEIPESDVGTPTKKARNNTSNDSNKTNTRKSKRFTRAGSEAKSPQTASRLVKRNVRARSVGPEANTPNKQQQGELVNTPIKTRRRTSMLMSEPVVEEKGEYMKYPVVTLDRTLPDLIETRESGTENSPKTSSKDESLLTSKNKLNTSRKSINEKHLEDDVKGPHNNPPENVSSNNFEDIEKDVFTDKKISDKNILESSKTLPIDNTNEAESLIDNEPKILPQNKDENTFIEDLNNPMEKHDDHNNKENLTTNIVTGLQDIKNAISNTQQSPKHVSINNLNANVSTEEKCKSSCIETSVSPKRRHSKQSLEMANENVSIKEVNAGIISNLPTEGLDISMNEEDNSNNMQNLVVGTKTESVIGSPCSESLDKNGPIQVVSINASSNDNVESMELAEDDNKSTEIGIELNVESKKAYVHASNANVSNEMDVSNTKENTNENEESEQNDINQCITNDQYDTKSKSDNLNTSENVHENDDISCIKLISSPKLSNIDSSNSVGVKSVSDTQHLTVSKHEDVPCLKNISETNNLSPNTSNLLKSSDAHMSIQDSTLINMNEANVTNVIKSSDSSIVTETPAEFVEEAPERGEQSKKVSVLDDSTDSLRSKKQYQNKLESNEKHTNTNQVTSEECQENTKADNNDSDTSVSHTFQDISASEWKEKSNDMDKNSIHSKTTENESEAECDLVLVDREAWLAAENLKTNKEKISFDYDSDDTVILKAHSDSMKAKNENNLMDIAEDECKLNDSKDKSPKGKKRKNTKQNENQDEEENRNTVEDTKNITKDVEISINVGENTSMTKDNNKYSTPNSNMSFRKSLKNNSLSESYETTEGEENLSLNKSKLSEDVPKGRKSLNKSVQEANRLEESNAAETVKKLKSLNKSNCNENTVTSAKKNGTNQSLNTSKEKIKPQQLDENSEESDYDLKKVYEKQDSVTKKKLNRNFSTIANMGSDSNETQNSDDSQNKFEIPKFLFCKTSDSNSDSDNESNSTIDSDIQKEYNFYGKVITKFPDDDIQGDECRASETESSDSDDNGSDLADFVVDDDEEEEDDESEQNKDGSIENDKLHNEEQTEEDQRDDEEEIKQEIIQEEEQHENDKENIAEKNISKETDASNEEKNTSRKSDDLSMSQTIRSDKKKKNLKTDRSQIEENEKGDNYPDLSFETKEMKQKRNSKEFTVKNVEQSLNDSQLIFDTKVLKLRKSIECSTPKTSVSKQEKLNVKTCGAEENDSLNEEKDKDLTLKEEQNVKILRSIKNNETLMHRSLPSELTDLATKTNLSRPMSSKVPELNKSTIVLGSETPRTKYLRQLKLNESAPILNVNFKKLANTSNSNEQNDQGEEEIENNDEQNTKAAPGPNDSLKKKLLKVAENILECDHQKKRKKRKQRIIENVTKSTLSETDFPENNDSKLLKTAKQFVPTSNIDNNDETEKENKKKRKKKKKTNNTDVQMQKESDEQVTEMKSKSQDEKIHNEIKKKKKKKEKKVPDVQDVQDLTNEKTKIVKKKKKKVSVVLSDDNIPNEQLLKKKQKLLAKDAALQDKKALLEKLPKKKRELFSEDDALQYEEAPPKKIPKKKQKLSSDVLDQKENTSVQKLSKKKQKQLLENVKTDNIKYTAASNKTQQFHDAVSDSDEGPETITFSKARDEALKDLKRTADNIKVNKEAKKKKQREHNEKMQKQKEIKIKQSKSKNQVSEFNKTDIQEKGIKQLPDYIVKNLSDVPLKSSKKRKLSEEKSSLPPTCSFKPKKMKNMYIEDDITLPSCAGNTTEFSVVDIETIKKKKKAPKASLFRERMLARNSRQPISAYLTYLKKQKSLGKGKFYDKPY